MAAMPMPSSALRSMHSNLHDNATLISQPNQGANTAASGSSIHSTRQPAVFEFTKRKRWADILISELPETIIFVLDPGGRVLYCGAAVNELLGWQPEDLVEHPFLEFVNDADGLGFSERLRLSVASRRELVSYIRLKCKSSSKPRSAASSQHDGLRINRLSNTHPGKELLFEIKGHPMYLEGDDECKCFFAQGRPYPSRTMAVMNTFLELKIENERLTHRLQALRANTPNRLHPGAFPISMSVTVSNPPRFMDRSTSVASVLRDYGPHDGLGSGSHPGMTTFQSNVPQSGIDNTSAEGDGYRKRARKALQPDGQHICVTCGRTNSPEWRKGPMGPKTLCNACGLRWAKRAKTEKTEAEGNTESSDVNASTSTAEPATTTTTAPPEQPAVSPSTAQEQEPSFVGQRSDLTTMQGYLSMPTTSTPVPHNMSMGESSSIPTMVPTHTRHHPYGQQHEYILPQQCQYGYNLPAPHALNQSPAWLQQPVDSQMSYHHDMQDYHGRYAGY